MLILFIKFSLAFQILYWLNLSISDKGTLRERNTCCGSHHMQRKNPSLYISGCKAPPASLCLWPLFLPSSSFLTTISLPVRSLFAAPRTWLLLCSLCLECSSPESTQLTPSSPLNLCSSLISSMRTTLSPYLRHSRSPSPNGSFNPPSRLYFFLFFIALDLLCHLLILLIHYCLSSLLESKLWETDVCLFCQLVYFKTLELCLAHSKDSVNTWWMNALSLSRGFHFGHPFLRMFIAFWDLSQLSTGKNK